MSNLPLQERRAALAAKAKEIDELSKAAMQVFEQPGDFAQELALASSIVDMRAMLTDEVMQPVMALMNTDLGFRTDRDPKSGCDKPTYTVAVVKEFFIEAKLRGFHLVGNECNIIAGRFYACQNGFRRKVKEATKGTFEPSYDVPVMSAQTPGKAKVKCRATWTINNTKFDIGVRPEDPCEIVVRVNNMMGDDAILGKAERKLLKRVYERITGRAIPEGEAGEPGGDVIDTKATVTSAEPSKPSFGKGEPTSTTPTAAPQSEAPKVEPATEAVAATSSVVEQKPLIPTEANPETPQRALADLMANAKISFDTFIHWCVQSGRMDETESSTFGSFDELPSAFCEALAKDTKALAKCLTLHGKK